MRPVLKAAGEPDLSAIFGMETPSAWSTITPGAVLGQSSTRSQGSHSLSVRPSNSNGYTPIKSMALTTLPVVSPTLAVDIMLPTYQPNPQWYGAAQAYVECPSRGIYNQFLNQVELTGKPLGVWNTVNFTLTNGLVTDLLQAGYSDLTITVVVNVQVPTTGIYLVDNLRFVPVASNGCGGRPNGTSCTDNSACTLGDTCQSGACHSQSTVTCTASDQCHDVGTCNPATGLCSNPPKSGTPSCNDGNTCTQTDLCINGVCTGTNPVVCKASDECHDVGTCDTRTGRCSNPAKPGTPSCNDGNACTQTDLCIVGVCTGTNPVNCPASDQCHAGVCDPTSAACSNTPLTGTACDDGNSCTIGDTCENGICIGSGSGYVGPGEQCAPATPTTPGPFGDFHCLLEEIPGLAKNTLTLGTGAAAQAWILRGTMDFSFTADGAKMTNLSASGQQSRSSLQNGIVLARDTGVASSGTVDMTSGNLQVTLPVVVWGSSGAGTPYLLNLTGQIGDRVLQGRASVPGEAGAQVDLFCREQFMNTVASVGFKLDLQGNVIAQGPIDLFDGTPTMPRLRSIPGAVDLVAELVSTTGEILDQYNIGQPWTLTFPRPIAPPPTPDPSATADAVIRAPLSNRLGSVVLRSSAGATLATADLAQPISSFCGGAGAQYCDYRAAIPVRPVVYAADITPRIFAMPPPASDNPNQRLPLPASPRLVDPPLSATDTVPFSHPGVALDADGNAVVVWRDGLDVLAKGIARDGAVSFSTTKVNDPSCLPSPWLPEFVIPFTQARPKVARSTDGKFVVGWSGITGAQEAFGFVCARVMNADGTPATDPILVTPAKDAFIDVGTGAHFDLAMTASGSFAVTWAGAGSGHTSKVYAQGFSTNGEPKRMSGNPPVSDPLVVASDSSFWLGYPTVALDDTGNAVIAWLKTDDQQGLKGATVLQRLNPDVSKLGDAVFPPPLSSDGDEGAPDVAMTRDGSRIMVAGGTTSHAIWASAYEFANGDVVLPVFRVSARQGGSQRRPMLANLDSGEFLVAWLDYVGVGTRTAPVISAQVLGRDGLPRDVDFTVTTDEPVAFQVPDPPLDFDQFPFDVAATANDYVAAWRTSAGVALQWVTGGSAPVDCPSPNDCGSAVPLRITGASKDKIDIIFSPGEVVRDDTGQVDSYFTKPYTSTSEFSRAAVDLIVNGYLANEVFTKYFGEFNFYYDMTQGIRHMQYDSSGKCLGLWGDNYVPPETMPSTIGYNGNSSFADLGGVIFRNMTWGTCLQTNSSDGLSILRYPNSGAGDVRTGTLRPFWIGNASDYSVLMHESGHATFGLREEYCSTNAAEDQSFHSNTFGDLTHDGQEPCDGKSVNRSTCRKIANCPGGGYWKADPDWDTMAGGSGTQYGPDCEQRAQCVMEDTMDNNRCP